MYDRDNSMLIQADDAFRDLLRETFQEDPDDFDADRTMVDIFEPLMCNSELAWFDPATTGDLTDAPIIGIQGASDYTYSSLPTPRFGQICTGCWGGHVRYSPILARWGWMSYALRSLQRQLMEHGSALLHSSA